MTQGSRVARMITVNIICALAGHMTSLSHSARLGS